MYPKKQFKFPTIVGLLLIGLIVGGLTVFSPDNIAGLFGRARTPGGTVPEHIRVSNITDSSLVVSWKTSTPTQGEVRYRINDGPQQTSYDVRDTSDQISKAYKTHYVELTGLLPTATVSYTIVSGGNSLYSSTANTGPPLSDTIQALPIHGEMVFGDTDTHDTIVFATVGESALWSAFIQDSTSWVIPLARIRTNTLDSLFCATQVCSDQTRVFLEIFTEDDAVALTSTLGSSRPVQAVSLMGGDAATNGSAGANQQVTPTPFFVDLGAMLEATDDSESVKSARTSVPTPTASTVSVREERAKEWRITILNPKQDAKLSFPKPLIRGQGIPDNEVLITLDSTVTQVGKAVVRSDGTWHWTPAYALEPGRHTVTIETKDSSGKKVTESHTFYILKSGQQVLQAATGSATLTPTQAPSPTPTTAITTPTIAIPTATLTPSPTPTLTPAPSIIFTTTPTPTLYESGAFIPSMLVVAGGAVLLLLAFALL